MELLYVWIKKYNSISEQGFNFSPEWQFDYKPEAGILNITKNEDALPAGFFGANIVNVTGVIGENGSGKTNLLTFLFNRFHYQEFGKDFFQHQDYPNLYFSPGYGKSEWETYFFILKHEGDSLFSDCKSIPISPVSLENKTDRVIFDNLAFVHYNPTIDNNSLSYFRLDFDISDMAMLYDEERNDRKDIIRNYFFHDLRKAINFLLHYNFKTPFFPQHLYLSFKSNQSTGFNDPIEKPFAQRDKTAIEIIKANLSAYKDKDAYDEKTGRLLYVYESVLFNILITLKDLHENEGFKIYRELASNSFYHSFPTNNELSTKELIDVIHKYLEEIIAETKSEPVFWDGLQKIQEFYTRQPERENVFYSAKLSLYEAFEASVFISDYEQIIQEITEKYASGRRFINKLPLLSLTWRNLSFGQQKLLTFFARIYDFIGDIQSERIHFLSPEPLPKLTDKVNSIIVLIDEGELGFHPEWQKGFLSNLITGFNLLAPTIPIQIILTSHSPFVVSDLPKENIIFLKQDFDDMGEPSTIVVPGVRKVNTFGANIHTLFTDSFFIRDGLIGNFAKSKINEVIHVLSTIINYSYSKRAEGIKDAEDFLEKLIELNIEVEKLTDTKCKAYKKIPKESRKGWQKAKVHQTRFQEIFNYVKARQAYQINPQYYTVLIGKIGDTLVQTKLYEMLAEVENILNPTEDQTTIDIEMKFLKQRLDYLQSLKSSTNATPEQK